jgi:hypothetical protein
MLESLKNVEKSTVEEAVALGGISVMLEQALVWSELFVSLVCCHFQNNYHESTHKEGTIDHFLTGILGGAIVENSIILVV